MAAISAYKYFDPIEDEEKVVTTDQQGNPVAAPVVAEEVPEYLKRPEEQTTGVYTPYDDAVNGGNDLRSAFFDDTDDTVASGSLQDQINRAYEDYYNNSEKELEWLNNISSIFEGPISPEEQAKRERAAAVVNGIGDLGNVLSAFGNLAFTAKGATPQKLPDSPDYGENIRKYRDSLNKTRNNYALVQQRINSARSAAALQRLNQAQKAANAEIEARILQAKYEAQMSKAQKAAYDAEVAKIKAAYQDKISDQQLAYMIANVAYRHAMTDNATALANARNASAGANEARAEHIRSTTGPNVTLIEEKAETERAKQDKYRNGNSGRVTSSGGSSSSSRSSDSSNSSGSTTSGTPSVRSKKTKPRKTSTSNTPSTSGGKRVSTYEDRPKKNSHTEFLD